MTPWAKRLAVMLAISVGLNLLSAGFWLGRRFGRPPPPPDERAVVGPGFGREARQHPALRRALDRHRDEFRERRRAIQKARLEAREALTREDFDAAALERALVNLRAETARSQELTHRAILEASRQARPEQRRALGRALGPGKLRD